LPCTKQGPFDSFSCGICAPSAIAHHYLPSRYPLIDTENVDAARLDMLGRIWDFSQHVPIQPPIIHNIEDNKLMTSAQSPKRELSIEVKCSRDKPQVLKVPDITQASTKKRSREEQPNEVKKPWYVEEGETDEEVPTFFKNILLGKAASAKTKKPPAKRPRTKLAKKSLRDSQSSMPKKRTFMPNPKDILTYDSTECEPSESSISSSDAVRHEPTSRVGRPRKPLLDRLTRPLPPVNGKKRYGCAGMGCQWKWVGRTSGRILSHACQCTFLSSKLRSAAANASRDNAPSAKHARSIAVQLQPNGAHPASKVVANPTSTHQTIEEPRCTLGQPTLDVIVGKSGRAQLKLALDPVIVKFICCNGIPPSVVDSDHWKQIFEIAKVRYTPVSRSTLEETQIPQEAAYVQHEQLKILRSHWNLTLTYDGGANKRHEPFYTAHVSIPPPKRKTFLVKTLDGSRVRHSADWLAQRLLKEVIDPIGRGHFGAASSDSTGNTKACRRMICATVPTVVDLPDP
ncbi:hypothetical protein FOMPIDRAFT_1021006, partial [Fomitopsis schrenkii]